MRKLIVQQSWINDSEFIGYYVAAAEGFYREANLDAVFVPGNASLTPERTLLEGTADIALCAPESLAATIRDTGAEFRVIAAQFQKSPLGIVSRADHPVHDLGALAGRTLSVPDMNRAMVLELLAHAGLEPDAVRIVPYAHDPQPLIAGEVDGIVDFVVDPQFRLRQAGVASEAILLFDHGAPLPNNIAVVTGTTFASRREELTLWVNASRRGWEVNYRDPAVYPRRLRGNPLVGSRTLEHETFANGAYRPMVEVPSGPMSLGAALVGKTCSYLDRVGLPLAEEIFVELTSASAWSAARA